MSTVMGQIASVSVEIGGKEITFETGKLAKQADGAVVMRSGDTMVLATAVGRPEAREGADFFPLTIDVEERAYAAGKIPGGFFKREGRATERATLTARMIDRPIRPLWPKGFRNEVQVICTVLSADLVTPHDILCINGASAALMLSPLPFFGPVGAVRVGRIDGEFVLNPTHEQNFEETSLDLIVVGTKDGLTMVEAGADEVPEDVLLEALDARPPGDPEALRGAGGPAPPGRQGEVARPGADRRDRGVARALDLGAHPGEGLREGACDRDGAPGRARSRALDGLDRRGHPAPGAGAREPRDAAREAAARRCRGPGAGAVRVGPARRSPTRSRTRRSSSPRSATCSSTGSSTPSELPFPVGPATVDGDGPIGQGLAHEELRQEGGRGDLQGSRPQEDRDRQAAPGRARRRGDPADRVRGDGQSRVRTARASSSAGRRRS